MGATSDREVGQVGAGPDVVSRGFVYVREAEDMMNEVRKIVTEVLESCREHNIREWGTMKTRVKDAVSDFLYHKTKRSPMILPVIQET